MDIDIEVEDGEDEYDVVSKAFDEFEKIIEKPCISLEEMFNAKILK